LSCQKPTFENLNLLINHQIKKSNPSKFSTLNLQNKHSLALKMPLVASCVEVMNLDNPVELEGSSSIGKTKHVV
jgi:hypothetical protein